MTAKPLSRQVTRRVARELKPPLVSTARVRRDTAKPRPGLWDLLRIQAAVTGRGAGHGLQLARARYGFHSSRTRAAQTLPPGLWPPRWQDWGKTPHKALVRYLATGMAVAERTLGRLPEPGDYEPESTEGET